MRFKGSGMGVREIVSLDFLLVQVLVELGVGFSRATLWNKFYVL